MAKKTTSKKTTPRPKKLKLVDRSPVGMTTAEAQELSKLYRPLSHISDSSQRTAIAKKLPSVAKMPTAEKMRKIAFDRCLYIYIEALCLDAKAENAGSTKRGSSSLRANIIKDIRKQFGRDLSPADIIKELAKHAPVPDYAKDAIRRDYLRVTV